MCGVAETTRDERSQAICAASNKAWHLADEVEATAAELARLLPTEFQRRTVKEEAATAACALRDYSRSLARTVGAV